MYKLSTFDRFLIDTMKRYGIPLLRISLAIVFLWFGTLKVIGMSPVVELVEATYPSFPEPLFITILGIWEVIIGIGLLIKLFLRFALALLWMQMGGIFLGLFLSPSLYFLQNNPLLLSINGEFVIKNFILVASSIVVGGYEVVGK